MVQVKSKGSLLTSLLLGEQEGILVLLRSSTIWMRLTHIMEDNLLYPKFANLNVNLIQKNIDVDL